MKTDLELLNNVEENIMWLSENYDEVRESSEGNIVAIKDKKIVAVAKSSEKLLEILREREIDESEVLIEVIYPKNEFSIFC